MNEQTTEEQVTNKNPGLIEVATEIVEMLLENDPDKYISVDIVPIKHLFDDNVIEYTMHKNWVNIYEDKVADPPLFKFDNKAKNKVVIDTLKGIISNKVNTANTVDDMPAIRFIVSYAKSTFVINAIMLIDTDSVKPEIPGDVPGVLVKIDIAAANAAKAAENYRVAASLAEADATTATETEPVTTEVANNEAATVAVVDTNVTTDQVAPEAAAMVADEAAANAAALERAAAAAEAARISQEKEAELAARQAMKNEELAKLTTPPKPPQETYADVLAHQQTVDLPTPPPTNKPNISLTPEQQSDKKKRQAEAERTTAEYEEQQRLKREQAIANEAKINKEIDDALALSAAEQARLTQDTQAQPVRLDMEVDDKQKQLAMEAENKKLLEQQRLEFNKARQQEKKNQKDAMRIQKNEAKLKQEDELLAAIAHANAEKAAVESARQQAAAKIEADAAKKKLEQDKVRQQRMEKIQQDIAEYKAREAAKKLAEENAAAAEAARVAQEKAAAAEAARVAQEKLAAAEKAAAEAARVAAEKAATEAAAQKIAEEKLAAEKAAAEKAAAEAEARAKADAEAKAKADAEAKAKADAEALERAATEAAELERQRRVDEAAAAERAARAKAEAEARVKAEAEARAKAEAEARVKAEAEARAKAEAEAEAKADSEAKAKADSEAKAKADSEANAKRMISDSVANKRAQKQGIDYTWRDTKSAEELVKTDEQNDDVDSESETIDTGATQNESIVADEKMVEKLATRAQINGYLKQISNGLNSILYTTSLKPKNVESHITNITAAYNELINPQISDGIKNLGLEGDDGILKTLTDLLDVLKKNIDGKYSNDQVKQIYSQANIILTDIDKILGPYDDIREERDRLLAAKRGDDTLEGIAEYTKEVDNALRLNTPSKVASSSATANMPPPPVNAFAKPRERLFPSSTSADVSPPPVNIVAKPRERLFPSSTSAIKPPPPPAKVALVQSPEQAAKPVTPHTKPAKSNVFDRLSTEQTFASQMHVNAGKEHNAALNANKTGPSGLHTKGGSGNSTKKKSRKSYHNKRHTKRATSRKQQPKTRNKRTKRGRNQTRKK